MAFDSEVLAFKRRMLAERLAQLTVDQRAFFHKIWKNFSEVPENKLKDAIDLCDRTIRANESKLKGGK